MTTAQDQTAEPSAQVSVTLDDCATQDARTVLTALNTSFPSDRSADDMPGDDVPGGGPAGGDSGRPVIWTATYDVSRTLALPGPARLSEPVTVTAQGGYRAVDRLREGLAEVFAVRVVGTAAGDQEQEAKLRLENR